MKLVEQSPTGCIAVIGVGYWGRNLARNFAEMGVLGGVVDQNERAATEVSQQLGVPVRTLADVLSDPGVTGVAVATRAETHYEVACAALRGGKHVFVEKPLVLDDAEAERLIVQADQSSRVLMVGHLLRYHPAYVRLAELVRSGEYGQLRHAYSDRLSMGKVRNEEDVLWSFAPHDLSMLLHLAGEEPSEVSAQGSFLLGRPVADWATLHLRFPSGVDASVRVSWMHHTKVQQLVAICDRASICFVDSVPDWSRKLFVVPHRVEVGPGQASATKEDPIYVPVEPAEPLRLECQHFIDCMVSGSRPLTDGNEGLAILRTLQRASSSDQMRFR